MPIAMPDVGPADVHNVPPVPPPDVFIPDEEDEAELDLPLENEPDTGEDPDEPEEERPGEGAPWLEEIRRRKSPFGDAPPPGPEKERKPDVDEPRPRPETERRRAPSLH